MIETVSTLELAPQDTNWEEYCWMCPDMVFVEPKFPKARVDAAGCTLVNPNASIAEKDEAIAVINNWRSSHGYPLQVIRMTLDSRARKTDSHALVVQRLKRLQAIQDKLARPFKNLSQMNDIGGCRAVVFSPGQLDKLHKTYLDSEAKNPKDRPELLNRDGKYNYVLHPKDDGYRSIHLILGYRTKTDKYKAFNGHRVEIQLRTLSQHAWATAVETVSVFTEQQLKMNVGDPQWKRFFALMGTAIAVGEKRPIVPGTPQDAATLREEIIALEKQLAVLSKLEGWSAAMTRVEVEAIATNAHTFLLFLDVLQRRFEVQPFARGELEKANEMYARIEKEYSGNPSKQVVLVAGSSWSALKKAYPNFLVNARIFIGLVQEQIASVR